MKNDKTKNVVAALIIVVAWASLAVPLVAFPPGINRKPHRALGQVLAEEAVKLLGNGGKVTVITRDTVTYKNPAIDAQNSGFNETLKKARVPVAARTALRLNPISLVSAPPGDFFNAMKKQTDADVIVSFMGPAVLDESQIARLGEKRPKVIALCSGTMPQRVNLKRLFDQKLLHAAVLSRERPLPGSPLSDSPRDWFDRLYHLSTPANLAEAPLPDTRP
jgi:ABC-type sugar transport system substrate-binding protein